jgi:hypothetical protein
MKRCQHRACSEFYKDTLYEPFCTEYCFLLRNEKLIGAKPTLERSCNWCGDKYPYRYGNREKSSSFCNRHCSLQAQGIQKYYAIANILKVKDFGLTAIEIAKLGDIHGCPMNYQKSSMRIRTMIPRGIITFEVKPNQNGKESRVYYLNPAIRSKPFKESLSGLDGLRNHTRRDKLRKKAAAKKNAVNDY